ncbi:MAG: UDP-N-acetylmuramate--alanine ligase [Burkholderiaceae bacterium]
MSLSDADPLRLEIAAAAARLIADGGLDYASAKRKAARQLLGTDSGARGRMPDNDQVDEALREHLSLFDDGHSARVRRRRVAALEMMRLLAPFSPFLCGAVWKGIVADHAPIHIQTFHDNPKEVAYALLDRRIGFEVTTAPHYRLDEEVEAYALLWRGEPCLISLYDPVDLRGALRPRAGRAERGDTAAVEALLDDEAGDD